MVENVMRGPRSAGPGRRERHDLAQSGDYHLLSTLATCRWSAPIIRPRSSMARGPRDIREASADKERGGGCPPPRKLNYAVANQIRESRKRFLHLLVCPYPQRFHRVLLDVLCHLPAPVRSKWRRTPPG